jgi:hypothetical protein
MRKYVFLIGASLCANILTSSPASAQSESIAALSSLHQALRLDPSQEKAWQAYRAEASIPTVAQDRRRAAAELFPTLTAPQRMDLVEAEMRQELTDLRRQSVALKAFYSTLTAEQRRIFDAQTLPPQNSGRERP